MSFDTFFSEGLRDAERRVPLLRPIRPSDQEAMLGIVRSSQLFAALSSIVDRLVRATETSVVIDRVSGVWSASGRGEKHLFVGLALIIAAIVHVGLVVWHERPPSWLWLILPSVAAAFGVLLTSSSVMERKQHG